MKGMPINPSLMDTEYLREWFCNYHKWAVTLLGTQSKLTSIGKTMARRMAMSNFNKAHACHRELLRRGE